MYTLGLMSGTSLDGIDAALVEITGVGDRLRVRQLHFETLPLPPALRDGVLAAMAPGGGDAAAIASLHMDLGAAFADAAMAACAAAGFSLERLDVIGSHGQTLWHDPGRASLQLGEIAVIAERTGVTTVGNFRAADVAAGGQGAPLVPYADFVLFGQTPRPVALLNLGGIGNITFLPGGGRATGLVGFDTGPGNMVLDGLMQALTGEPYDRDGALAAAGKVHEPFLAELLATDPFLALPPPKSTGREAYGEPRQGRVLARARALGLSDAEAMATVAAWTAASVAESVRRFLPQSPEAVYVSGGGARNPVVMRELAMRLPMPVRPLGELGFDPDAKEALAFALFAHQTLLGQPNSLPQATGATGPRVLGQIAPGRNFARAVLAPRPAAMATEGVNPASRGLDTLSALEAARVMHAEDYTAVAAVGPALPAIAELVERVAAALQSGGRLFYVGAGTSGRLGVLDASECPPTFSTPPEWVQGLIAGGEAALTTAVEGAEDDAEAGRQDLLARGVGEKDVVVGLSASGGAPYVLAALSAGRERGATTALVTCNPVGADLADVAVVLPVGPEILSGSTRLKAGTATKLALNMLSTLAMVRLGKVHDNLMVDVKASNRKLLARARRLVVQLTGASDEAAEALLARASGSVKRAVAMHALGAEAAEADARLAETGGRLRPLLEGR